MAIEKPYRRTCRQLSDGSYAHGGNGRYIKHREYAQAPEHYVRAFFLIQSDMLKLFEYVEPSKKNLGCYSYRIHELLLRTCVEVEANLKAILLENGYQKSGNLNMGDYVKINRSHRLSSYRVKTPHWRENERIVRPFAQWSRSGTLPWYQAYNRTKHDRHKDFELARFGHVLNAICGLVVVLSSQFMDEDFSGAPVRIVAEDGDPFEWAVGEYFKVQYPIWPKKDRYSFNWRDLKDGADPFQNFNYT